MGCGCRKKSSNDSLLGQYQVWRNGAYTGRSFSSLAQAQNYAERIGGEVRTI
jgi:hypothetical protein